MSASRGCGVQMSPVYWQVVKEMRDVAISPPGRVRPSGVHPLFTSASTQGRQHRMWCPPGFEVTRAEVSDKFALFEKAKLLRHPLADVTVGIPADLEAALDKVSELRGGTPEWREARIKRFEEWSSLLWGDTVRIQAGRPAHVVGASGNAHAALYMACIDAIGWPHTSFAIEHCVTGFQVVGRAEDTGVWALRSDADMRRREAEYVPPRLLRATNKAWITTLQHKLKRAWRRASLEPWGPEMTRIRAAWDASMKEVQVKGTAYGPFTVDDMNRAFGWGNWRPAERFAVWQGAKFRPCDNMKLNGTNGSYISPQHIVLPKPDAQAALGRGHYQRAKRDGWLDQCDLEAASDDEPDAYRHSASASPELGVVMQVEPVSGGVRCFRPMGHNFGEEAAVQNYCSKPELHCAIGRRFFAANVEHFFDDYVYVDPRFCLGVRVVDACGGMRYPSSSQGCMWRLNACLGSPFALEKHVFWNQQNAFSGVITDFRRLKSDGILLMRCKPSTVKKVRSLVADAMESESLTPAQAASLRGKLLWTWLYIKVGRSEMRPIAARQYGRDEQKGGSYVGGPASC